MKLTFLGAAHEVTGSCTLLTAAGKKILIDCGMEQGPDIYENCSLPIAANDIDFVLLTHAHIDHSGKIPYLVANGFSGKIYATKPTCRLSEIMLLDSAHIQESEAKWRNRKAARSGKEQYVPIYTVNDALATAKLLCPCDYEKEISPCEGIKIKFYDSGHLLGSSSIEITVTENGKEQTIVFSGDLGNNSRPILRDPIPPKNADFVVIESTYGDRLHGQRPDYKSQLSRIIKETFDRGGNLVIPSFAVGRTQELLFLIREIKKENLVTGHKDFPVYVDSPLAIEATEIFDSSLYAFYDEQMRSLIDSGIEPIKFNGLKTSVTSDESRAINDDQTPKVIISASGMCEAGRIRHHLKHNLWRENSTVLFVGYQSVGTLGRKIIDGADTVKLFGEEISVRCHIETLKGISGHADKDMLTTWIKNIGGNKKMIFVNHGDDTVCADFAAHLSDTLGVTAVAPYNGAEYDLDTLTCLDSGNMQHKKVKSNTDRENVIYQKLLTALHRITAIIEKCRGYSNKELSKMTSQLNELCDKWEK